MTNFLLSLAQFSINQHLQIIEGGCATKLLKDSPIRQSYINNDILRVKCIAGTVYDFQKKA